MIMMKSYLRFIAAILFCFSFPTLLPAQQNVPEDITIDRDGVLLKSKFFDDPPFPKGEGLLEASNQ